MEREYKYDAFISYRHIHPDKDIADKIQRMLENYKPPKSLEGVGEFKKWHIFRDETELPTSSNLGDDIQNALENSKFLIVVCSPKTKESRWCMEEIEHFKKLHNGNNARILTVVADGTPEEAFPKELCNELVEVLDEDGNVTYAERMIEPLAANVSSPTLKEAFKKLKSEFLRIAAPMLGCGYDALYNREQKKKIRRLVTIGTSVLSLFLAFLIYNSAMLYKINRQKTELEVAYRDLQVKNSEVYVNQAKAYKEAGDIYSAVKYAYEAIPEGTEEYPAMSRAERVLTEALGVYEDEKEKQISSTVSVSGYVRYMEASSDGKRLIVMDETATVYLIDAERKETIKIFTPYETFKSTSNYLSDIKVAGNTCYMVANGTLLAINTDDGSEKWRLKDIVSCEAVLANEASDVICIVNYEGYSFIEKESGNLLAEKDASEYISNLTGYFYMSGDGMAYAVGDKLHIVGKDYYKTLDLGMSEYDEVLSIGECDDAVYINIGKSEEHSYGFTRAEMICIEKENCEIKWKTAYDVNNVSGYNCNKMLPLTHKLYKSETDKTMVQMDGMAVFAYNAVYMFERGTGKLYSGIRLSDDEYIIAGDRHDKMTALRFISNKNIYKKALVSTVGSLDEWGAVVDYLPEENMKNALYFGSRYAFYKENSSDITIVENITYGSKSTELPGLGSMKQPENIKDNEQGIVVVTEDVYPDDGEKFSRLTIYDGEKIKGTAEIKGSYTDHIIIAGDRIIAAGYERIVMTDLEGNILDDVVLSEKIKELVGKDNIYSGNIKAIALEGSSLFAVTSCYSLILDISENKVALINAENYDNIATAYASDKSIVFFARSYDKNKGYSGKIVKLDKDGINCVKNSGEDYVFGDSGESYSSANVVSNIAYFDKAGIIAFNDITGFIGIYKDGEESFSKIEYDSSRNTVYNMVFSGDGKYLFAIMAGGRIVKYSVETLSQVSENELDVKVDEYTLMKELNENTLFVCSSSYYNGVFISEKTLEIKGEAPSYMIGVSYDGSRFYVKNYTNSSYNLGYYEYLSREKLKEKAKEFLGIE